MSVVVHQIRRGTYFDSIVLMRLQGRLIDLPGIEDAEIVMATQDNLARLESRGWLELDRGALQPDDLLIVVVAAEDAKAHAALDRIDELLAERDESHHDTDDHDESFRPRSLETAVAALPRARWVSISVPGVHAARVAKRALELDRNVFLYSDNVAVEDERELKEIAAERGLLMLGPDCGTTIIAGVGFGFANRIQPGPIGLIGASGTGIQAVCCRLSALGTGISHAIGIGGRDLSGSIGGLSALQAFDALDRDPQTEVVVLISKPPDPAIAARLIRRAHESAKPVVIWFPTSVPPARRVANVYFALGSSDAAQLASGLAAEPATRPAAESLANSSDRFTTSQRLYLRGLFSGGTLALEVLAGLRGSLAKLSSNLDLEGVDTLADPAISVGHTIVDLGADELTIGRPHPMLDPTLRLSRFRQEIDDPETAVVVLDFVLGDGADPDPASAFEPTLRSLHQVAASGPRVIALVVGTKEDPQQVEEQATRLANTGALVVEDPADAIDFIARSLISKSASSGSHLATAALDPSPAVINVGVEDFYDSLRSRGVECLHVEWRPPAGGNERLIELLERVRSTQLETPSK